MILQVTIDRIENKLDEQVYTIMAGEIKGASINE